MKELPVGTHVIGTDGQDIYYGVVTEHPHRGQYYIRMPHSTSLYWIYQEKTIPLSMFVPSLETLLDHLPAKPEKGPVLVYMPDGPIVGYCKNGKGLVRYDQVVKGKVVSDEFFPGYAFPMQSVIDRQLKPFMEQLK